jgi:hypothetical protein
MVIEFKRSPIGLGYAYRKGSRAASLSDKVCKELIEIGIAIDVTPAKPKAKPKDAVVKKAQVKTTDVRK